MNKLGIEIILVKTNVRKFHERPDWDSTYVSAVIGTALLFDCGISKFYLPEINTFDYVPLHKRKYVRDHVSFKENSTVPLLSTEKIEVSNREGVVSRLEKIEVIAKWPETYDKLRVCWENPNGLKNCCRCNKCLLTMTALDMQGVLGNYATFPKPIERKSVRRGRYTHIRFYFPRTWIEYAKSKGRNDIWFDYTYVLWRSRTGLFFQKLFSVTPLNELLHPLQTFYKLSCILKQYFPVYSKFVRWVKNV